MAKLRATLSTIKQWKQYTLMKVEAQIEDNTRQFEANTNILEAMQTRIDAVESKQKLFILWWSQKK